MSRKREIVLLVFLGFLLIAVNYNFADSAIKDFITDLEEVNIERIIDGDTIVVGNDTHVRMLGINTPEKGEKYYNEAKEFLSELILNKTIELEYGKDRKDKYGRTLAFVFLDGKNVNIEMIKKGFANVYVLDDKKYEKDLRDAWNECIAKGKNLCEKSKNKCVECIEIKGIDFEEQEIILENKCSFNCNLTKWNIKDEGRKKFVFGDFILEKNKEVKIIVGNKTDSKNILYWEGEEYVWTETGDTLFLRDEKDELILWDEL